MEQIKKTLADTTERVENMSGDVEKLKGDVKCLKEGQEKLKKEQGETKIEMANLSGKLDMVISNGNTGNKIGMATLVANIALIGGLIAVLFTAVLN